MIRRLLGALVLLMSLSSIAFAESPYSGTPYSAKAFEPGCRVIADATRPADIIQAANAGKCIGAVQAIALLNDLIEKSMRHCVPTETTVVEQIKVITKFMDGHPERMNQDFVRVAMLAFYEAWPCR
jgi:hypothetical protein